MFLKAQKTSILKDTLYFFHTSPAPVGMSVARPPPPIKQGSKSVFHIEGFPIIVSIFKFDFWTSHQTLYELQPRCAQPFRTTKQNMMQQ